MAIIFPGLNLLNTFRSVLQFYLIDNIGSYIGSSWGTGRISWIHILLAPRLNKRDQKVDIIPGVDIDVIECEW